jgi:hypothetical protein
MSDNKVCELATVCLPWQQWTETSVWFDDNISTFHSRVVVDLWQSLSKWHLLLSKCVLVRHHENVGTNIKFLVKLGKNGSKIREILVQVYRDNATSSLQVGETFFSGKRKCVTDEKRDQDSQQQAELKKTLQKFVKLRMKIIG